LVPLARTFLAAGANLLLLVEEQPLPAGSGPSWRAGATTVANVARFHRALPVVAGRRLALAADPSAWRPAAGDAPVVTTLGPAGGGFAAVREAVGRLTR
jgi:hypothetical protein